MTPADKPVAVGAALFCLLLAWLFGVRDAVLATGGLVVVWLCLSRQWLTLSWQFRLSETELATWKPPGMRLFSALLALLFGAPLCLCLWAVRSQLATAEGLALGVAVLALLGPFTLLFFWMAGPDEMRFDFARRSYRSRTGFPFVAGHGGGLDELTGVYVAGPDRQQRCKVYLGWNRPKRSRTWVAEGLNKDAADELMRRIAARLQIPCAADALAGAKKANAWSQPAPAECMSFGKPRSYAVFGGVMMVTTSALPLWAALNHSTHWTGGIIPSSPALSLILMPCGPAFLMALYLASPARLELNLQSQTYRFRICILMVPLRYTGTFEDIGSLSVEQTGKNGTIYRVLLNWKTPRRPRMLLGEFDSPEAAEAQRRQLMDRLELTGDV